MIGLLRRPAGATAEPADGWVQPCLREMEAQNMDAASSAVLHATGRIDIFKGRRPNNLTNP